MVNKRNIKVLGGIVLFNPDMERIQENVNAVYPQVDQLLLIDNGSDNITQVKQLFKNKDKLRIIEFGENKGISGALIKIMNIAIDEDYDWVLTLDHDSVVKPKLVENYKKFIDIPEVACMSCRMEDRNFKIGEVIIEGDYEEMSRCITSGCFMRVSAYKESDGYSEDLFIDRVDDDICYNLTMHGYKTILVDYLGMLHEMGYVDVRRFLWTKCKVQNYSPFRRYYIFRNETIIRNKYPSLIKKEWLESGRPMWVNFCLQLIKISLYEKDKWKKIRSMWKGWSDGRKYVKNKLGIKKCIIFQ